jgi:hypothetical protein
MRRYLGLLCLVSLLVLSACSGRQNSTNSTNGSQSATAGGSQAGNSSKPPPADVVRVEAGKVELKQGGSAEASVKVTIANGYHINANPASFSYLIATELQLQPSHDVTAEAPKYPASVTKTFAFSKDPLNVYEGTADIKVSLSAASKAPKGDLKLGARLRVQPCDEQTCFPPRTIETSIPITIN